jgi:hypothetical protein
MADPFAVFRASPNKQKTLLALWPELHEALAGPAVPEAERVYPCVLGDCAGRKPPVRAVARLSRWGHAACAAHVARSADRSGGWPLDPKESRNA